MTTSTGFLGGLRTVTLIALFGAGSAFATTLTTCETQTNPSSCPTSPAFLVSNNGGQSVNYYSENITVPSSGNSTGVVEIGYLSTTLNSSASSTPAPASFNLWVYVGSTVLPYFSASISSAGTLTFSANSGADSSGSLWAASTSGSYTVETNTTTGLEVEINSSEAFNSSSFLGGKQTVIDGIVTATPEPATYAYIGVAGVALVVFARRRRMVR